MASVARYEEQAAPRAAPARAVRPDGPSSGYCADPASLAAFRVLATIEYERSLATLIECEIIPRLMVAHSPGTADIPPVSDETAITAAEIEALAPLALEVDADALLAHVEAILARGISVDTVMIDLLAPAARRLGEFWEDDRCDFVDVTMGLWRLQEVVHEIAARASSDRLLTVGGHRALFASMPGDQHSFGTVVIDEIFRRDGWITDRLSEVETPVLLRRVGGDWFDMVGLTVSCDCHIAPLPSIIAALRNVSKEPACQRHGRWPDLQRGSGTGATGRGRRHRCRRPARPRGRRDLGSRPRRGGAGRRLTPAFLERDARR